MIGERRMGGRWHGGFGGGMGMGGTIPRTNKAAHTSCGNGPACALTRPGNLHPPPLRAGGLGQGWGTPCCGRAVRPALGGRGGMPIPATWGAEPGPAEVLFLWKRALLCQRPLCAALSAPPGPQPGGGAAPGAGGGRGPLRPPRTPRSPAPLLPAGCAASPAGPRRGGSDGKGSGG